MGLLNLDFSSVPQNVILDEGVYNVTLEKLEEKVASTGKPMLLARFKEETTGAVVFENYVLTPEALWKFAEVLSAAGIDIKTTPIQEIDTEELEGLMFRAKIVKDQYEGRDVNRIKKLYAA